MVDSVKPTSGLTSVRRTIAVAPTAPTRASEIARAAAKNIAPNPAADLAAWGPPIDEAKIAALRDQITAGTYKAEPDAIAAKMIESDMPAPAAAPAAPKAAK